MRLRHLIASRPSLTGRMHPHPHPHPHPQAQARAQAAIRHLRLHLRLYLRLHHLCCLTYALLNPTMMRQMTLKWTAMAVPSMPVVAADGVAAVAGARQPCLAKNRSARVVALPSSLRDERRSACGTALSHRTNPLRRRVGAPQQCSLGSAASHRVYADVKDSDMTS